MRSKIMLALCLLLLFLTACQKQTSDDPIVASYKDTQIHESLVAYEKQNQINVTGDKTVSDADLGTRRSSDLTSSQVPSSILTRSRSSFPA